MTNIQALRNLPQEIRLWLASDSTAEEVRRINSELDLQDEERRLIPHLLFRLVVKDLTPEHFTETLSDWLDIAPSSANTIAKEIKDRILAPASAPLRSWGIEISLIRLIEPGRHSPVAPQAPLSPESAASPPTPPKLPSEILGGKLPTTIEPQPEYQSPPPPMGGRLDISEARRGSAVETKAFPKRGQVHIIGEAHEHTAEEKPITYEADLQPRVKIESPQAVTEKKEKKIKLPIPQIPEEKKEEEPFILHKETVLTPVSKEYEIKAPPTFSPPPSHKTQSLPSSGIKVVHYNEETTPQANNQIKLEKKHNQDMELMRSPPPPIKKQELKNQSLPKLKGNMVDLR